MFGSFGWMELLLILIIVLIIFGAGKIPQLGEGLGKAIKGFKKSVHDAEASDAQDEQPEPRPLPHQNEQSVQETATAQEDASTNPPEEQNISQPSESTPKY